MAALGALATPVIGLAPMAFAGTYTASDEATFRAAIAAANADPDPNATITLTANVPIVGTTAFPAFTKPVTINTGSFTLQGANIAAGAASGTSLTFSGGTFLTSGSVRGGNGAPAGSTAVGGTAVVMSSSGTFTNNGTITGGQGGTNGTSGGNGGTGASVTNGSLVNNGTIVGGAAGGTSLTVGGRGGQGVILSNSTLQNNGTIQIGQQFVTTGTDFSLSASDSTIINTGTFGHGMGLTNSTIINSGTITGGGFLLGISNVLELRAGSVVTGAIRSFTTNDTLRLGGDTNSTFDASSISAGIFPIPNRTFNRFDFFQKTGSSIWTLINAPTGTTVTSWELLGGKLSVSSNANLGGTAGTLTFDGGALQVTGTSFTNLSRTVTWGANGGGFDIADPNNVFTVSSSIGGSTGSLTKSGPGTLVLTGTNTYTGGTVVEAGVLQGHSTSLQGNILNNAAVVFDQGVDGTYGGAMSGSGTFTKTGTGTLILSGTNTYSGGTTVAGGTLQGSTSSLQGNILNNASVVFDQATSGTYAGAMSGMGSLTKAGAGTLILAGANTYSGGTTVSDGVLQGNTASLKGDIVNNASVVFDQAGSGTYAGAMSGTGGMTLLGGGLLNITGTNTFTGPTTADASSLIVNGSLASTVTLNQGSLLGGTGTIGGLLANGATLAPGNSIGTLTVAGNFTQNGGTYVVEVNAQGQNDRFNVTGTATINGGTVQVRADSGTYSNNTTYTILNATGGVTGTYAGLTEDFVFLTPTLTYDANNVYLSLLLLPNAFREAGQTVNQQAVGGALDVIAGGGKGGGLITIIANLNDSQGAPALQALSSEPYADFGTVNIRSSQLFMNAVGRQMAIERGDAIGAPKGVALAEACDVACDDGAPRRFSGWLSGIGSTGTVLGDGNTAGLTYTLGGTAFGIDYRLDPRFLVGIAGGYVGGSQWVNGFGGNAYTDSLNVALYGSFTQNAGGGGFYADALAGYANYNNRLQRVIAIPGQSAAVANGQTSANQFLGQVETGYKFGLPFPANTSISPFGRLQVGSVNQAAFTESGSSVFNLAVAQQTTTSVRTTLGADFGASFDMGGGRPLDIGLRLGWMHEFADTARPITAAFAAAPVSQFTVFAATPQRDAAVIGLSASMAVAEATRLYLRYEAEIGSGTDDHALNIGLRLSW